MGNSRRLKRNKQRGMERRSRGNKPPMSLENKEARKKLSEKTREMTKAALEKSKKK